MLYTLYQHAVLWRNLHSWRAHYELSKLIQFLSILRNNILEEWGWGSFCILYSPFLFQGIYLHREGFSDIHALKNAGGFCLSVFCFLMQLKLEVALSYFWWKEWIVNTVLGKGRRTGEGICASIKLFVIHCFHFSDWILMITWKWY